jgi:hypothetical protein
MDHGALVRAGDVSLDLRLQSGDQPAAARSNFINPTMVVFVVISLMLVTGVIEFEDIVAKKARGKCFSTSPRCSRCRRA